MPKKSYTLAPLREMSFFGVPRRGCQGVGGYATKATLKTLTQSVKELWRLCEKCHFLGYPVGGAKGWGGTPQKQFSFFWQSLTLLAGVVDKRNRTPRNGSALYVTIRMQPTHATQRNRCVRSDLYATNATHTTQRNRCVRYDLYATHATQPMCT